MTRERRPRRRGDQHGLMRLDPRLDTRREEEEEAVTTLEEVKGHLQASGGDA
jgi:hypothetical protein